MPISAKTWQTGVDSQTACNLSGLAHYLPKLLEELRANNICSTDALNRHPLVKLIVAQMAYLAYGTFDCGAGKQWDRAYHLAQMETGRSPYKDRPLELGEKERILARWEEEDRQIAGTHQDPEG
jgi:hypothetical protein